MPPPDHWIKGTSTSTPLVEMNSDQRNFPKLSSQNNKQGNCFLLLKKYWYLTIKTPLTFKTTQSQGHVGTTLTHLGRAL